MAKAKRVEDDDAPDFLATAFQSEMSGSTEADELPAVADVRGNELDIPLELVLPPLVNSRYVYDVDYQHELASSIVERGLLYPILVTPALDRRGYYYTIDGWNRVCSSRLLSRPSIRAIVEEGVTPQEQALRNFSANWVRRQPTDFDIGLYLAECIKREIIQRPEELLRDLGRSQTSATSASKFLSFSKLPEQVQAVIKEEPEKFSYNVGYDLYLLYDLACKRHSDEADAADAVAHVAQKCRKLSNPSSYIKTRRALLEGAERPAVPAVRHKHDFAGGSVSLAIESDGAFRLRGKLLRPELLEELRAFVHRLTGVGESADHV